MTEQEELSSTLEAFLASPDLKSGVISSTKASWAGSGYSVELFPDGTWQVLRNNQIGNLYVSPGEILKLPALDTTDLPEYEGDDGDFLAEGFYIEEEEIKAGLRESLAWRFRGTE